MFGIKDSNPNKELVNLINQFDTTILGIENVKAQINGNKEKSYTLVFTPIGFFIISRVKLMRNYKAKMVVSLFDINGFDFISKNKILCHFGHSQTILLEIENYKEFIQSTIDHHSQMFYRSPFIKPIQLKNFPQVIQPTQPISAPPNIISLRYISICAKYKQPVDPETKHFFEIYEKSDKLSITFNSKCQPPINYHTISSPLMHEPLLHGLIFDQYSPHNVCKIIYSLLKYNKNIISIIMRNYSELSYEQFGFNELKNPSVVSWHFSNLSLVEQRLSLFFSEFKNYQGDLIQLSLDHLHFSGNLADRLAKLIAFGHCFRTLEVLNLTFIDSPGQNINKILNSFQKTISQLKSLQKVTLANWAPHPAIMPLSQPSNSKTPNPSNNVFYFVRTTCVRYLSLTSFDLRNIDGKVILPTNLNCLELHKCKFNCKSLIKVLTSAVKVSSPFVLSLSEMDIENSELQQFYHESSKLQSFKNLVEFDYSCNPIPTHFIKEFNRIFISPSLKFLSLNNVFGPDQIPDLAAILAACETNCHLWGLELMGGKIKKTIGPKLKEVFPFIIQQTQLEHLNISRQQFTDMIINDVYSFLDSMKNLLYLSADGSAILKLQTLFDFYEYIFVKTRTRAITRPFMDLDTLILDKNLEETISTPMFLTFKQRMLSQMTPSDRFIRTFYYIRYPDMNRFQTFLSVFPLSATELPPNDKYGINCTMQTSMPLRSLSDFDFQEIRSAEDIGTYQSSLFHSPFDYVRPLPSELKPFELPPALKPFKGSYEYDSNLTRPEIRKKVKPREIVHKYQGMINVKNKPLFRNLTIIEDLFDNIGNGGPSNSENSNKLSNLFQLPKLEPPIIIPNEAFQIIVEQMETLEEPTATNDDNNENKNINISNESSAEKQINLSSSDSTFSSSELYLNSLPLQQQQQLKNPSSSLLVKGMKAMSVNLLKLKSSLSSNEIPKIETDGNASSFLAPIYPKESNIENINITSSSEISSVIESNLCLEDDEFYEYDDDNDYYYFLYEYDSKRILKPRLPELPSTKIIRSTKYGNPDYFFSMSSIETTLKGKQQYSMKKSQNYDYEYESDDENKNDIDDEQLELLQVMINDPQQQETLQNLKAYSIPLNKLEAKCSSKIRAIPNDPPEEDPNMPKLFNSLIQAKKKYCFKVTANSNYTMKHRSSSSAATLINLVSSEMGSGVGVNSSVNSNVICPSPVASVSEFIENASSNSPFESVNMSSSGGLSISSNSDFDGQDHSNMRKKPKRTTSSALSSNTGVPSQMKLSARFRTAPNNPNSGSFSSILSNMSFNTPNQPSLMKINGSENESSEDDMMPDANDAYTVGAKSPAPHFKTNNQNRKNSSVANNFAFNINQNLFQTLPARSNAQSPKIQKSVFDIDESSSSGEMIDDTVDMKQNPNQINQQKIAFQLNQQQFKNVAKLNNSAKSPRKDVQCFSSDSGEASEGEIPAKNNSTPKKATNNGYSSESGEASDGEIPAKNNSTPKKPVNNGYSSESGEASDGEIPAKTNSTPKKPANNGYSSESGEASDDMNGDEKAQGQKKTQSKAEVPTTVINLVNSYSSGSGEASDDMMPPPDAQKTKKIVYPNFGQNQAQKTQQQVPKKAASYSSGSGEASDDMMPPPDAQKTKKIVYPNFGQSQNQPPKLQTQQQQQQVPKKAASYSSGSGEASDDMMPPSDAQQTRKITYPNFGPPQTQQQNQQQKQPAPSKASYSSGSGEASDDMMPPSDAQQTRKITYPNFGPPQTQQQQKIPQQQPVKPAASYSSGSGEASDDMMPPSDAQQTRKITYPNFGPPQTQQQNQQQKQPAPSKASYSSGSGEASDDMMPPPDAQQIRKITYPSFSSDVNQPTKPQQQPPQPKATHHSYSSGSGEASDDMMPPPDQQQLRKIAYPNFGANQQAQQFQQPQVSHHSYSSGSGEASDDMMPPPEEQPLRKINYPKF